MGGPLVALFFSIIGFVGGTFFFGIQSVSISSALERAQTSGTSEAYERAIYIRPYALRGTLHSIDLFRGVLVISYKSAYPETARRLLEVRVGSTTEYMQSGGSITEGTYNVVELTSEKFGSLAQGSPVVATVRIDPTTRVFTAESISHNTYLF